MAPHTTTDRPARAADRATLPRPRTTAAEQAHAAVAAHLAGPPGTSTSTTTGPFPRFLVTAGNEVNGAPDLSEADGLTSRQRAGRRQEVMWKITDDKNLAGCHRWARGGEVGLSYSEGGTSEYVGLQNTRSRWASPLAEVDIMRERRIALALAVKNWLSAGGAVVVGVGTVRHKRWQSLEQVDAGLRSAWQAMVKTRKFREERDRYGIRHFHADYEFTWSRANGMHPHRNFVLFVDGPLSCTELEALEDSTAARWITGAVNGGLRAPSRDRAVRLEQVSAWGEDAAKIAVYLAKGMAAEFTGAATKKGRGGSLTAFELLDVLGAQEKSGEGMDHRLVDAWRQYERVSKGWRSSWSRGAKKVLGIDHITEEQADDIAAELAALAGVEREERVKSGRWVVATIPAVGPGSEWSKISTDMGARQRITEAVESARSPEEAQRNALVMLAEFGVAGVPRMVPMDGADLDEVMPTHAEATRRDLAEAVGLAGAT